MKTSPVLTKAGATSSNVAWTRTDGLVELTPRVPLFGFGLALAALVRGPVLSTVSATEVVAPQLTPRRVLTADEDRVDAFGSGH